MKKPVKSFSNRDGRPQTPSAHSLKTSTPSPRGLSAGNPSIKPSFPPWRILWVAAALAVGFYLIYNHQTMGHTFVGFALWIAAISLSLAWFPQVPGAGIFPMLQAPETGKSREWNIWGITLISGGALAALGVSNYFLGHTWIGFLLSLFPLGWCLTLLENHRSRPSGDKLPATGPLQKAGFPWEILVILSFGSFFLFYGWNLLAIGYDADSIYSLEMSDKCRAEFPTPYVDGWGPGVHIFPYFLIGMFFKVVGCSFQKGVLFTVLVNLVGYLFFYGFTRFYLPKFPALAATLLYIASHWVLWPAREITGARGLILPMECATLYFFAKALEGGRARDYTLFGALLALSLLSTIHGWVLLALFILALLAVWIARRPALQKQKASWALALLVVFLWFLPALVHDRTYNVFWFPIDMFSGDLVWNGRSFLASCWENLHVYWKNFGAAFQMVNISAEENLMGFLPLLSPWEGLFFLAGLGWCFRRLLRPSALFIILGLLGGFTPAVLTSVNITLRSLPAVPFVFLLVGIGLDRLTMVLAAPMGRRGRGLRFLVGAVFVALAVGWQYDVFFNQLPKYKDAYWNPSGRVYLFGTITARHLEGWDTYVDLWDGTNQHPENDYFYSVSDMQKGKRFIFRPDQSPLPLKNIPPKGALILLPDKTGKAFKDWIGYYYPAVQEKDVLNPFGDVEYRLWEINPAQIQEALNLPGKPESMTLSWYDTQNRKLGQWQIPTLSAELLNTEWFGPCPGKPDFPWQKTAYFVVEGSLKNPAGKTLALETNGKVDGFIGSQGIQLDGQGTPKRLEFPLHSQKPDHFKIRYVLPKGGGFYLDLSEKTPMGWDIIASSELNP